MIPGGCKRGPLEGSLKSGGCKLGVWVCAVAFPEGGRALGFSGVEQPPLTYRAPLLFAFAVASGFEGGRGCFTALQTP